MSKLRFRLGGVQKMEVRRPPTNHQKSMQKRVRKHVSKKSPMLVQNGSTWGPTWAPRGELIWGSARLGANFFPFSIFCCFLESFCVLLGPSWHQLGDHFGTVLGPCWDHFGTILWQPRTSVFFVFFVFFVFAFFTSFSSFFKAWRTARSALNTHKNDGQSREQIH